MKILITGKGGQLAWELEQTAPNGLEIISLKANELDITNQAQVNEIVIKHSPDIIINAAAYTAVDKAETDRETAYAVNDRGSEYLALICKEVNAKLIHVSTDFIFDGTKTTPYQTDDTPNPINVYGDSKLQGDLKVSNILGEQATIIRTAWVYSANGNNFVKTMLRLMTEKDQLGIVYDQVGTPTWAKGLAKMIWGLLETTPNNQESAATATQNLHSETEVTQNHYSEDKDTQNSHSGIKDFIIRRSETEGVKSRHSETEGVNNRHSEIEGVKNRHSGIEERDIRNLTTSSANIYHWTDAGVASWYDFAVAIQELALEKDILEKVIPIKPIPASHYPTPAARPSYSVIDKTTAEQASGLETTHWRKQLSNMLDELKENS